MSTRRWILVLPFPYTASTDPNHRLRLNEGNYGLAGMLSGSRGRKGRCGSREGGGEPIAKLSGGGIRCRQGMAHCSTADARWLNVFNVLPAMEQS